MILECASGVLAMEAGEDDIRRAIANDRRRGGFLVLTEADRVFIQATGRGEGPYVLDYCPGNTRLRFRSLAEVPKAQVEQAFISYLMGDGRWLHDIQWQRVRVKPWWRFW